MGKDIDPHTRGTLRQIDIHLEEGYIDSVEYKMRVEKLARRRGYKPEDLMPGAGSDWHLYSRQQGFTASVNILAEEGCAGWGVNRAGRLVPIDYTTQVWESFERWLQISEEKLRQALNLGKSYPLVTHLRQFYDKFAHRIISTANTYPLTGSFFEKTAPFLEKFLFSLGVPWQEAYKPPEEYEDRIMEFILDIEEGRYPVYRYRVDDEDLFGVFPQTGSGYVDEQLFRRGPVFDEEQTWRLYRFLEELNARLHAKYHYYPDLSVDYWGKLISEERYTPRLEDGGHWIIPDCGVPVALFKAVEASSLFVRPNGEKIESSALTLLPPYQPEAGLNEIVSRGGFINLPNLLTPHYALMLVS